MACSCTSLFVIKQVTKLVLTAIMPQKSEEPIQIRLAFEYILSTNFQLAPHSGIVESKHGRNNLFQTKRCQEHQREREYKYNMGRRKNGGEVKSSHLWPLGQYSLLQTIAAHKCKESEVS